MCWQTSQYLPSMNIAQDSLWVYHGISLEYKDIMIRYGRCGSIARPQDLNSYITEWFSGSGSLQLARSLCLSLSPPYNI